MGYQARWGPGVRRDTGRAGGNPARGHYPWPPVYVKLPAHSFGKEKVDKVVIIMLLIREGEE